MKHLVIYYIATSNYKMGFEHFKKNLSSLYPDFRKTVIILSDGLEEWNNIIEDNITYKTYHIDHFPWPIITLFKMKYIYDHRIDCDYACYFNGNLQYNPNYDTSLNKIDLSKLNVSRHVSSNPNLEYDDNTFENIDSNSQAYIGHNYKYIHGGLFIGPSDIVYEMCKDVSKMCEIDLGKNIIPQWHDESYLNKWCEDNAKLVKKERLIKYAEFDRCFPFSIIETIDKDRRTLIRHYEDYEDCNNILIDSNEGRFANQLFPIFTAVSNRKDEKIYFKNYWEYKDQRRIKDSIIERLSDKLRNIVCFDNDEYDRVASEKNESCKIITGYCQNIEQLNFEIIHDLFSCNDSIRKEIENLYGDISEYVCLHVRRGDYLNYQDKFKILTKEYIIRCLNKYFPNTKIICISDDMMWCKENLSELDIIFADKHKDVLLDFYIQTLTCGNICSASTFSIAGAIINPYRKLVIPFPFFKCDVKEINLYPYWAIKEEL